MDTVRMMEMNSKKYCWKSLCWHWFSCIIIPNVFPYHLIFDFFLRFLSLALILYHQNQTHIFNGAFIMRVLNFQRHWTWTFWLSTKWHFSFFKCGYVYVSVVDEKNDIHLFCWAAFISFHFNLSANGRVINTAEFQEEKSSILFPLCALDTVYIIPVWNWSVYGHTLIVKWILF